MKWNGNDTEVLTYSTIGTLALAKLSGFTLASVVPFMPIVGIGAIGLGSLYEVYRIATRDEREHKELIKEQKENLEQFFIGAGIKNKMGEIPMLSNIWEGEYETIYSFIKPSGFSTHILDSNDIAIKEYFKTDSIEFESNGDFINIKVTTVELPRWIPFQIPKKKDKSDVIVSLGKDVKGKDVELNLSKCPNVMVSGCTRQW